MRVRVVLVANPAARRVDDAIIERSADAWSAIGDLTLLHSRGPATAADLTPLLTGADAVVVLGGDGILNTVANAMLDAGSDAVLVPLPGGTTNVAARSLGLPGRLVDAEPRARRALLEGRVGPRGVGRLNGRAFVANAGIGFDAAVVARTEASPRRKRRFGHSWFAAAAAVELLRPDGVRRTELRAEGPGPVGLDGPVFWVVAMALHPYTYVGRRRIEPVGPGGWRPQDDGLRVLGFAPMATHRLLRLASSAILTSRGIDHAAGVFFTQISTDLSISSGDAVKWQIDGEPQPAVARFTLSWHPAALRVLNPAAAPHP